MKTMTAETKNIIITETDKLLDQIMESVHTGLCEEMSPNDPEFSNEFDKRIEDANELLLLQIQGE